MKKKILIVEDEIEIVKLIKNRLCADSFSIHTALDGNEAMDSILANRYDLVILDIMLPKISGLEICNHLHKHYPTTYIFIMSALTNESQKIKAYELGADSYVSKPFSPRVLISEIMALFRRHSDEDTESSNNKVMLKDSFYQVIISGQTLQLTPSEYLIFSTLFNNKSTPFSRIDLSTLIYEHGQGEISERGIDSHIAHMRKKLDSFEQKNLIETVRGKGYVINEN